MPLSIFTQYYTRGLVLRTPHYFYVFGDNVERTGKKGQACIRGLPNAIGIATKWRPAKDFRAFFRDDQFEMTKSIIDKDLERVESLLRKGKTVYLPPEFVGKGLAQLPTTAPKTFQYVVNKLKALYIEYRDEGLKEFCD